MDCMRLQNENSSLRGQKRKLEEDLYDERCKTVKIDKLKEAVAKNKEIRETSSIQEKVKRRA